jgi:adenosine deaminase
LNSISVIEPTIQMVCTSSRLESPYSTEQLLRRRLMKLLAFVLLWLVIASDCADCQTNSAAASEARAEAYFESIRSKPLELYAFLRKMPKGGDLHLHLTGSVYAESYVEWMAKAKPELCIDTTSLAIAPCNNDGRPPASRALTDGRLYGRLIDAWSMRDSQYSGQSGHDQFFATFGRFGPAGFGRYGDMVAEVASRAASNAVSYVEIMFTPDNGKSRAASKSLDWPDDEALEAMSDADLAVFFSKQRSLLLDKGILNAASGERNGAVQEAKATLDQTEARARELMKCAEPAKADPGCGVTLRYIFQIARSAPHKEAFGQMVAAMETAKADPRVLGLNLVQPEDSRSAVRNFSMQMRMLDYLRTLPDYHGVHISLHAGELAPGLVPPEVLRFHVRDSVQKGHAERIGHGVDVMYEDNPEQLLREMAKNRILVEICLSSNQAILGISGKRNPLSIYLKYGVPVALATDDLGVSRSDMTNEYLNAAEDQGLTYRQLKAMARASLEYAFIDGENLWTDAARLTPFPACGRIGIGMSTDKPSASCQNQLNRSAKARLQWELERAFSAFEKRCCERRSK